MKFKISKVKGVEYLQIWKQGNFVRSCGNAEKLNKKLVRLEKLEIQTNKYRQIVTNFIESKEEDIDLLLYNIKKHSVSEDDNA